MFGAFTLGFLSTCAATPRPGKHDLSQSGPSPSQPSSSPTSAVAPTSSASGKSPVMKSAKEECEDLMSAVMPFAHKMLTQHREFYPFGGAMTADGQIISVAGYTGQEHPASQAVIDMLEQGFQESAKTGKYKATALVIDMRVVPPGRETKQDAIAVRLDHRDGYSVAITEATENACVVVVFPYTIGAGSEVTLEAPFAVKGEQRIFPR